MPERCSTSVPPVINNICRSAVPAQKYLPERRSAAFRHHYIPGRNSRTERPRKTKIGKEIAYVTRDSDTNFKVKWSKDKVTRSLYSARPQRVRRLQRSAWECIRRGKVLLRCVCSAAREGLIGLPRGGEGRRHIVSPRAQLVTCCILIASKVCSNAFFAMALQ